MDLYELSFAKIIILRDDIAEVMINDGVEMDTGMVDQYHVFLLTHLQAPFSLLINKVNSYTYTFEAQEKLAEAKELHQQVQQRLEEIGAEVRDEDVVRLFLDHKLPEHVVEDLTAFLEQVHYPIAVRSSSLLEDSQYQPFAGVYATYMLPNSHETLGVRLDQLCDAIKLVYASVYHRSARAYLEASGSRVEEAKMAVVLQEVVGRRHGDRFYPDVSGVGRSYNFYPTGAARPEEGVVSLPNRDLPIIDVVRAGLGKLGGELIGNGMYRKEVEPNHPLGGSPAFYEFNCTAIEATVDDLKQALGPR